MITRSPMCRQARRQDPKHVLREEATRVLTAGGPVVLCGTIRAMGTTWAQSVVNAARAYSGVRVFGVQIEQEANLRYLTFDTEVAAFWLDPDRAAGEVVAALAKHYPIEGRVAPAPMVSDEAAERRFRDVLLGACDIVDLANLPIDRHVATRQLMLRSLFVPLKVRLEREAGRDMEAEELVALERRRRPGGGAGQAAASSEPGASKGPAPPTLSARGAVTLSQVGQRLQQSRRLVVLGEPGAGKTTLLRWVATAYLLRLRGDSDWAALPAVDTLPDESWLPILIRCRELGAEQLSGALDDMLGHVLHRSELAAAEVEALKAAISQRLDDGTALLLIDGLDEITEPGTRARFCRQLEQIYLARPNTPIIATSRIVGYREMGYRIGRGFEHVTLAELDRSDKDDFVRRWCAVTEPPDRQHVTTTQLVSDIHSTDRIERLTGNPLLLTTMALVKRNVGKLPDRRADLYREAVHVLLNWRAEVDEPIDHHEAMPQLEYIAYAMADRGVQQLADDEIIDLLDQMRVEYPTVHPIRRRTAAELIRLLERRTGLLEESGYVRQPGRLAPVFEFRHLTFQEYLAALALVEGRFPGRDRGKSLAENVGPLAGRLGDGSGEAEPAVVESWREPIRLCVTICNDDDVDGVLAAVLTPGVDDTPARPPGPAPSSLPSVLRTSRTSPTPPRSAYSSAW
jgi:energy-coupling factor transporter ATP-binding protein EcfA2